MKHDLEAALAINRRNTDAFVAAARTIPADRWRQPRAEGKWSPAQVAEHVAIAYEVAEKVITGEDVFPGGPPRFIRPLIGAAIRLTTLRTGRFPKSKTQAAFVPKDVAASQAELCDRLQRASTAFERFAADAVRGGKTDFDHPVFGRFGVVEYVRFSAFHTAHHQLQLG